MDILDCVCGFLCLGDSFVSPTELTTREVVCDDLRGRALGADGFRHRSVADCAYHGKAVHLSYRLDQSRRSAPQEYRSETDVFGKEAAEFFRHRQSFEAEK